jgi:hypothetical protein
MRIKTVLPCIALLGLLAGSPSPAVAADAEVIYAEFTYQGVLQIGADPAPPGTYWLQFKLYDADTGGTQIGPKLCKSVEVSRSGSFTVVLDFGADSFPLGPQRWLEIGVAANQNCDDELTTWLRPRHKLTAQPTALNATFANQAKWSQGATNLLSPLHPDMLEGDYPKSLVMANPANRFAGDGAGLGNLDASKVTMGTLSDARLSPNMARLDSSPMFAGPVSAPGFYGNAEGLTNLSGGTLMPLSITAEQIATGAVTGDKITANQVVKSINGIKDNLTLEVGEGLNLETTATTLRLSSPTDCSTYTNCYWSLYGNGNTDPRTNFLGTIDAKPLIMKVQGMRAFLLEPTKPEPDRAGIVNVVGGAPLNLATPGVLGATIAGGGADLFMAEHQPNTVAGNFGTIGGGFSNSIAQAAAGSTIGGGARNSILNEAIYATIPGGEDNAATLRAFAAGRRAKAVHPGSFVWADSQDADFFSTTNDQVSFRCLTGVRFTSGIPGQAVEWIPGTGLWTFTSDRAAKEDFVPVDTQEVLDKVASLPITEWNYKGYPQRHIGPVAQDFHALFPLNESDTTLNEADLHGVALAAIKGLHERVREKDAKIADLEQRLVELEKILKSQIQSANGGGQ